MAKNQRGPKKDLAQSGRSRAIWFLKCIGNSSWQCASMSDVAHAMTGVKLSKAKSKAWLADLWQENVLDPLIIAVDGEDGPVDYHQWSKENPPKIRIGPFVCRGLSESGKPLPSGVCNHYQALGFKDYDDYINSPLWRAIRKRVLDRDGHECCCCDGVATQVHHRSYELEVLRGDNDSKLISICKMHHDEIESEKDKGARCLVENKLVKLIEKKLTSRRRASG